MDESCPICKSTSTVRILDNDGGKHFICRRCGDFKLSEHAKTYIEKNYTSSENKGLIKLSYWLRNKNITEVKNVLQIEQIKSIIENVNLPKPKEQADILLKWIGEKAGMDYFKRISEEYDILLSLLGTENVNNIKQILEFLRELNYIRVSMDSGNDFSVEMTMLGWEKYEELIKPTTSGNLAFMAMEFNKTELEKLYIENIKKAVAETGFIIEKLNENQPFGLIDDQLRVKINKSRFLIADLTHNNSGAYWEAGYAEGQGKPVLYICKKEIFDNPDTKPHFDTNHHLTVLWENTPEGLQKFEEDLKATIRATFPAEAVLGD